MRYFVCIAAILFALLHLLAGAVQWKRQPEARGRALVMLCGAAAALISSAVKLAGGGLSCVPILFCGLLLICAMAILNGRAAGKINPAHHAVRIAAAVLLVLGFIFF